MRNIPILVAAFVALIATPMLRAADAPASQPAAQPVDYHKLKDLMPDTMLGQKRTKNEGQKIAAGDLNVSQADAEYSDEAKENPPRVEIQIMDYSATKGMAESMAAWKDVQVDREGDDGFERTIKISDQPAMETYKTQDKNGEIHVFVAGRYIVNVTANNISADDLKKLAEALPIAKLAALK